jgi:EAL domain-containing protein (putative c-di-GMP-specific phosphodiesterase class I)
MAASKGCGGCQDGAQIFPFTMAFQPIVDVTERRIVGHEALVRGCDGEGAAAVFAQVNAGNVYPFDQACRVKAIDLASRLGIKGGLSINFLPRAVYEPRACIRLTLEAAARTGLPLDRLTFEFVEHEEISDSAHLLGIVKEYRNHGFKIALDDFGTGYSGLARLVDLMPDSIKLDRALLRDCDQNPKRLAVVAGIISLTAQIGVAVVGEGIEREGEFRALQSVGLRFMQGYYFAKPKFEALVTDREIAWPGEADPMRGV